MAGRNRRRIVVVGSGAVTVVLGMATVVGLLMASPAKTSRAAVKAPASAVPTSSPTADPAAGAAATPAVEDSPYVVADEALAFLKEKDPGDKVAGRVKEIVESGNFLRVYTDLPEGDKNSKAAISLCEWTAEYLKDQQGDKESIVFIHAKKSGNGSVVLANKQSAKDDCEVGATR